MRHRFRKAVFSSVHTEGGQNGEKTRETCGRSLWWSTGHPEVEHATRGNLFPTIVVHLRLTSIILRQIGEGLQGEVSGFRVSAYGIWQLNHYLAAPTSRFVEASMWISLMSFSPYVQQTATDLQFSIITHHN